jgi:hypothetical protein
MARSWSALIVNVVWNVRPDHAGHIIDPDIDLLAMRRGIVALVLRPAGEDAIDVLLAVDVHLADTGHASGNDDDAVAPTAQQVGEGRERLRVRGPCPVVVDGHRDHVVTSRNGPASTVQ